MAFYTETRMSVDAQKAMQLLHTYLLQLAWS